ncbi:MAG: hypothetical protein M0P12_00100 [Paludibacteraceae bacterium]|jgi:hypothetical protein|nr:hypothetical protein [Paludibacteraceae bacterium]MCK9615750.1 hypothetical protein [Candidatus Omnitrophota bacterium]
MWKKFKLLLNNRNKETTSEEQIKKALRQAILSTTRIKAECTEFDSSGSTFEIDWLPEVKEWAKLSDLDLSKYDPESYVRL